MRTARAAIVIMLGALAMVATGAPATPPRSGAPPAGAIAAEQLWAPPTSDAFAHVSRRPETVTKAFTDEWPVLVEADRQWEPAADVVHVPSTCLDVGDHACIACFTKAYTDLDFAHATLERLRAIYGATKLMSDQALATGDRLAPTMAAGEDEWQRQRSDIVQSMVDLKGTYRGKYIDLMKTLTAALLSIGRCERFVYGEAGWFDRYGKPLMSSFDARYRLAD